MTGTETPEALAAALDAEEAAAKAVEDNSAPWDGQWEADENLALRTRNGWVLATALHPGDEFRPGVLPHIARQDPARTLRRVRAHRDLVAAILSEPHHRWPGVSACLKATFPDEECACGRDERVERVLAILAGIYSD